MRLFKEKLTPNGAMLTGYLQERSHELSKMAIRPTVLIFPGGAYHSCSDREAEPVALAYMHHGYNAFVLRYTLIDQGASPANAESPRAAAGQVISRALEDAESAVAYLRDHAEDLAIDPERIAVVGFSAGGNLAALLGTCGVNKPNAMILGYAATDDAINRELGLPGPCPTENVDRGTPPSFLFATQGDSIVPASGTLRFALALAAQGVPYECHVYLTGDHGLSLAIPASGLVNDEVSQWHAESLRFLEKVMGAKERYRLSIDASCGELMADERAAALLSEQLPGLSVMLDGNPAAKTLSLRRLADYAGGNIPEELLTSLDRKLKELK